MDIENLQKEILLINNLLTTAKLSNGMIITGCAKIIVENSRENPEKVQKVVDIFNQYKGDLKPQIAALFISNLVSMIDVDEENLSRGTC